MKNFLTAFVILLFASCGQQNQTNKQPVKTDMPANEAVTAKKASTGIPENVLNEIKQYYQKAYGKGARVEETNSDTVLELVFKNIPKTKDDYDGFLIDVYIPKSEHLISHVPLLRGDLNNDKADDLVVSVHTEGGGTGGNDLHSEDIFVYLNNNGTYQFASMTPDNEVSGCEDAGSFTAKKIEGGYLKGESSAYAEDDPMCCPSLKYETKVRFSNGKLVFDSKGVETTVKY